MYNFTEWVEETNPGYLKNHYRRLLNKSGFTVLKTTDKHFVPFGYTLLFLLGESHLAIHTFPEENKSYIELTSCVLEPFNKFKELNNKK